MSSTDSDLRNITAAVEVITIFSQSITQRGSGFPMLWKYPAGNKYAREATEQAILERLKDHQAQVIMPVIQELPSVELQSATDLSLTQQERSLYHQAIKIVSDYLAGTRT